MNNDQSYNTINHMSNKRASSTEADEILGLYFPVLDHGFVSLVDYMGSDSAVVQAARASYGSGTKKTSDDRNLIRYLMRHKHTTPTEMVELKFHMKMPIFVARQFIRHRTASVNEYSGRYSLMPMQFYTPAREQLCTQSKSNKQGRDNTVDDSTYRGAVDLWSEQRVKTAATYEWLLEDDVARELARLDLPLSTYTEWYWKIDLHNLFHFLRLRCDSHAQWEIIQLANLMAGIAKRVAPDSFDAWIDYSFAAKTFSKQEQLIIKRMLDGDQIALTETGLGKREQDEFTSKLALLDAPVPNFDLDISSAKSAEYFEEQVKLYTPAIGNK